MELLTSKVSPSGGPVGDETKIFTCNIAAMTAFFDRKESGQKETPDLHFVR